PTIPGGRSSADVPINALRSTDPFASFVLPEEWQQRFWVSEDVKALMRLEPKAVAALVPTQAGFRFCRCPSCGASETDDPLSGSLTKPDFLTCRRCAAQFPNDKIPAKGTDGKVPEEVVEVLPRIFHRYPFHSLEAERQLYPDERIYLAAKRDHETREFLA